MYTSLIVSQHAAQLQTRHFECEKFLFKVVLLSSASIARANRFGSGRLCWTTCTKSTSSQIRAQNANSRKSMKEQQITTDYNNRLFNIFPNYPEAEKKLGSWSEHGQDLHQFHSKTGFNWCFCYLPGYKTARAFCSLLDRVYDHSGHHVSS